MGMPSRGARLASIIAQNTTCQERRMPRNEAFNKESRRGGDGGILYATRFVYDALIVASFQKVGNLLVKYPDRIITALLNGFNPRIKHNLHVCI